MTADLTDFWDHDIGCCAWHGAPCTCHLPEDERLELQRTCDHKEPE